MENYEYKMDNYLIPLLRKFKSPNVLELGVQSGISTKKILEVCNENNGHLYSVDIDDCSGVSNSARWKFLKSRDDNFYYIFRNIPKKLDIIYLDTLHEAKHVENIFYNYYPLLNVNGYFIIDDISHLPYLKKNQRNNFYCEINNKETFDKILEIFNQNKNLFDLSFAFNSSGLAIIKKKSDMNLHKPKKLILRKNSIKNFFRLLLKSFKRN